MVDGAPEVLFVFGDNLAGWGKGGQAVIRDCRNAVGIPTKKAPRLDDVAYFTDADLDLFCQAAAPAFKRLADHLRAGEIVIWPADGIGTGRAELPERAPRIWAALERARLRLEAITP